MLDISLAGLGVTSVFEAVLQLLDLQLKFFDLRLVLTVREETFLTGSVSLLYLFVEML